MEIGLNYKGKKVKLEVKKCNFLQTAFGLMFTRRKNAKALLFDFGKRTDLVLTSYFVFFPFIAIWLDEQNKVLDVKVIKPFVFTINAKKPFSKIVEIPLNSRYKEQIKALGCFTRR